MPYTTAFAFFEAIWEAGIRHVFVNLGTDHPSLIEAFVKGKKEQPDNFPKIITCPNEMVALAMADGYARLTGKPQCVVIHVDVGTQGLGAAVHDACMGRCPVLIFAGLTPYTIEGEHRGSRNEYIHWIQDVPDQRQIIGQYCRYTAEIKTGRNVKQLVNRALSFATSDPRGPVYLVGAREVMEQEIEPYKVNQDFWRPIEPAALTQSAVEAIARTLVDAKRPLVITGYSGRNHDAVRQLVKLANTIRGLRVLDTGGSDMSFPATHPGWLGLRYGVDESIGTADVILVIDSDTPWIPTQNRPRSDATIFHIDVDPLKQLMPVFYLDAISRYRADSFTALSQINDHLASSDTLREKLQETVFEDRWRTLQESYAEKLQSIKALGEAIGDDDSYDAALLLARVREAVPEDTIWVVEAVTVTAQVADQIQASLPGSYINCGGGGLGWSGGGALGIKLAAMSEDYQKLKDKQSRQQPSKDALESPTSDATPPSIARGEKHLQADPNGAQSHVPQYQSPLLTPSNGVSSETGCNLESVGGSFVCQVVGDGTFLFSVPSSVYWISSRYKLPILTIVLNNEGWRAPRRSALLMHPDGYAAKASLEEMNVSFAPSPDYAGIAKAAAGGKLWAGQASTVQELDRLLPQAVQSVKDGLGAVLDAHLDGPSGKYTSTASTTVPVSGNGEVDVGASSG